jgi:FKBP-type peptidyl-prolyl cis-trans isomerase
LSFRIASDAAHYPQQGDSVMVHYRGFLQDGSMFDSSYDRGQPLNFRLGAGQVIRGEELASAAEKRG